MPLLGWFFEVYSNMTEKQRLKPKNSSSLQLFASFDTLLDPRGAKVVEIRITSKTAVFKMILRANTPVCSAVTKHLPQIQCQTFNSKSEFFLLIVRIRPICFVMKLRCLINEPELMNIILCRIFQGKRLNEED